MSESEVVKLDGFERLFAKGTPVELEQAQVKQVETLRIFFNNLDRLNRNATLYHFEHSSVEGLKKRLAEDIEVIFAQLSEFTVEVQPFELVMFEHQVFEHQNVDNHYLFRMYQDGVRRLTMRRGMTEAELLRFCRLFTVDLSRPDMFEDDVVTLIWKEGFQHITIQANDLMTSKSLADRLDDNSFSSLVQDLRESPTQLKLGNRQSRFSQLDLRTITFGRNDLALFRFNDLELSTESRLKFERLLQSNDRERFEKFVEILFQIHLQFATDSVGRSERIAVLFDRIADAMLDSKDFAELERLVNKLNTMGFVDAAEDREYRSSVEYILEHWGQEAFIDRILAPVFSSDTELTPSCVGIISRLSGSAVPALVQSACRLTEPRTRGQLWEVVARNLKGNEVTVARSLVDASLPIAREILNILSSSIDPESLGKLLLNGLRNSEASVRLETMSCVERIGAQHAMTLLLRALDDVDASIRGKALHLLARHRDVRAMAPIWECINGRRFAGFSLDEKRRFCVTYALCGGDLGEWRKLVSTRNLIQSTDVSEMKHCALIALGVRVDPEIDDVVERLSQKKRQDLVVEAASWVKQHIACPREERTRQLYAIFYSGKLVESRRGDG